LSGNPESFRRRRKSADAGLMFGYTAVRHLRIALRLRSCRQKLEFRQAAIDGLHLQIG
jgi:hypothetical protein